MENEAEVLETKAGTGGIGKLGNVGLAEEDGAVRGREHARHAMQQRGLAGARGPHDGDGFAGLDVEGNTGEDRALAVVLRDVMK